MLSEIGSNFWITPDEIQGDIKTISPSIFNCAGSDYVWLSTGRSAISYNTAFLIGCRLKQRLERTKGTRQGDI